MSIAKYGNTILDFFKKYIVKPIKFLLYNEVLKNLKGNKSIHFSYGQVISFTFWLGLFLLAFAIPASSEMLEEYFIEYHFPFITFFWLFVFNMGLYIVAYDFIYESHKSKRIADPQNNWLGSYFWSNAILLFLPVNAFIFMIYYQFVFGSERANHDHSTFSKFIADEQTSFIITVLLILFNLILSAKIYSKDLTVHRGMDLMSTISKSFRSAKSQDSVGNELQTPQEVKNESTIKVFWIPISMMIIGIFYYRLSSFEDDNDLKASVDVLSVILVLLCVYRYVFYFLFVFVRDLWIRFMETLKFTTKSSPILSRSTLYVTLLIGVITTLLGAINLNTFYEIKDEFSISLEDVDQSKKDSLHIQKIAWQLKEDRLSLETYFKHWVSNRKEGNQIYLVAGQGGGSRAGLWTFQVMKELAKQVDGFNKNLFAVSSVSGSSVGASLYLNSIAKISDPVKDTACISRFDSASIDFFTADFVTKPLLYYLGVEPINILTDNRNRNDVLLELMRKQYNTCFYSDPDSYCSIKPERYDALFRNFSSGDISESYPGKVEAVFMANTYDINQSKPAVSSSVKLNIDDYILDIGTLSKFPLRNDIAVNLSEMFPFLSASAYLKGNDGGRHHFYDGGVYDNYGISTLLPLYRKIRKLRDNLAPEKRIVVIIIDNSPEEKDTNKSINNSVKSLYKAVSNSTFRSVPNSYLQIIGDELRHRENRDRLIKLPYNKKTTLNRWLSKATANSLRNSSHQIVKDSCSLFTIPRDDAISVDLTKEKGCRIFFNAGESQLIGDYKDAFKGAYQNYWKDAMSDDDNMLQIIGYADNSGKEEDNRLLTLTRATNVYKFLESNYPDLAGNIVKPEIGKIVKPKNKDEGDSQHWRTSQRKAEIYLQ